MSIDLKEKIMVKVGDEEVEMTIEDLQKGFLRQSDYTKKNQDLSDKEKKFLEDIDGFKTSSEKKEADLIAWNKWWTEKGQFMKNADYVPPAPDSDGDDEINPAIRSFITDSLGKTQTQVSDMIKKMSDEVTKTQNVLRYTNSLNKLYYGHHMKEHPEMPFKFQEMQDAALERGKQDLSDEDWMAFYNEVNAEDFNKLKVDAALKEKIEAEEEKKKADHVEVGKGSNTSASRIFKLADDVPATISEAEEGALGAIREAHQTNQ